MTIQSRKLAAVGIGAIVLASFVVGALFMNLFVGEVGGVGPGTASNLLGANIGLKVDTVTVVNTANPDYYLTWGQQLIYRATGKMWAEPDGTWSIYWSRHAGVLLNDGADFIEDQISDSPGVTPAAYISLSRNGRTPQATDHKIFDEIDSGGGLDRVGGTYTSTGVGQWTVAHQFTADTDYVNVQSTGLCWSDTDNSNTTTLCCDTFGAVTLASGDKITVTWTVSVS